MNSASTKPTEHAALQVLRSFVAEMHDWEALALHQHQTRDWENSTEEELDRDCNILGDKLADIFNRYCEIGERAKRVREPPHFGGAEPDYNPDKEQIVSVVEQGEKVIVETKMTHNFCFKLKYELVKDAEGAWKIRDNRKSSFEFETKWKPWPL